MYEADIQAAIDRQLELERKAAAWDKLVEMLDPIKDHMMLALLSELVHPDRNHRSVVGGAPPQRAPHVHHLLLVAYRIAHDLPFIWTRL